MSCHVNALLFVFKTPNKIPFATLIVGHYVCHLGKYREGINEKLWWTINDNLPIARLRREQDEIPTRLRLGSVFVYILKTAIHPVGGWN